MTSAGARAAVAALAVILPAAAVALTQTVPDRFPHEQHAGLFPLCSGCHAGVLTAEPAEAFPKPELCAQCHDGGDLERVVWKGFLPPPDNVAFDHVEHARVLAEQGDPEPGCQGCHASPVERMRVVGRPDPTAGCLTCHAHAAADHIGDASCATCHVPLAASGFSRARIASLPRPADHESPAFLAVAHGAAASAASASCATCHAQQLCTSCHVDGSLAAIRAVPPAPAGMELPAVTASYPVPATHTAPEWLQAHGADASLATCGSCHTRNDCASCHQGSLPAAVTVLPVRREGTAPGAGGRRQPPESHRSRFFAREHGGAAATDASACATCHTEMSCADCHRRAALGEPVGGEPPIPLRLVELMQSRPVLGPTGAALAVPPRIVEAAQVASGTGFHPGDFALRHTTAAYGQTMECANCHSVEAFCKACHAEVGLAATRPGPGFHDGGVAWLLGHGQQARQGLESCASCHAQRDCTQCHSQMGSFRVNPHGPGFDAARAWERSPGTCLVCHIEAPLAR